MDFLDNDIIIVTKGDVYDEVEEAFEQAVCTAKVIGRLNDRNRYNKALLNYIKQEKGTNITDQKSVVIRGCQNLSEFEDALTLATLIAEYPISEQILCYLTWGDIAQIRSVVENEQVPIDAELDELVQASRICNKRMMFIKNFFGDPEEYADVSKDLHEIAANFERLKKKRSRFIKARLTEEFANHIAWPSKKMATLEVANG